MNWLIYIGGWFLGWAVFNGLIAPRQKDDIMLFTKLVAWTCIWAWTCWKFIS